MLYTDLSDHLSVFQITSSISNIRNPSARPGHRQSNKKKDFTSTV